MSPPNDDGPDTESGATTTPADQQADSGDRTAPTSSQRVSWWSVHEYVAPILAQAESLPTVGTPAWCLLADDDPAKTAALFDAARHWALRLETCQEARCEASREIADAADWSAVAKQTFVRNCFYDARPWLKRVAS